MNGGDILRDDRRLGGEEFFDPVESREHRDIEHAAVFGRFDIVNHVADKHRLSRIERVGMQDLAARPASSLPYGAQRRLEIARALALRPSFLLLDEPAAGMNPAETDAMIAVLRQIRANHQIGLLVVEHDLKLIMRLCDHIVVLNKGQMIAEGTPEEIRANPAVIEAYIGKRRAAA